MAWNKGLEKCWVLEMVLGVVGWCVLFLEGSYVGGEKHHSSGSTCSSLPTPFLALSPPPKQNSPFLLSSHPPPLPPISLISLKLGRNSQPQPQPPTPPSPSLEPARRRNNLHRAPPLRRGQRSEKGASRGEQIGTGGHLAVQLSVSSREVAEPANGRPATLVRSFVRGREKGRRKGRIGAGACHWDLVYGLCQGRAPINTVVKGDGWFPARWEGWISGWFGWRGSVRVGVGEGSSSYWR